MKNNIIKLRYFFWKNSAKIKHFVLVLGILSFILIYSMFLYPGISRISEKKYPNSSISTLNKGNIKLGLKYGGSLDQTFTVDDMGISGIRIRMNISKPAPTDGSLVQVVLYEENGRKIVQEWNVTKKQRKKINKRGYAVFKLDKELKKNEGTKYRIVVCDTSSVLLTLYLTDKIELKYAECYYLSELQDGDMAFESIPAKVSYSGIKYLYIVSTLGIILLYLIIILGHKRNMKVQNIFLIFALFWGVIYLYLLPPYSSPDEQRHFATAYRISNHILHVKDNDSKFAACRNCDNNNKLTYMPTLETYRYVLETQFKRATKESSKINSQYKLGEVVAEAVPYSYFPQTIGITVARVLRLNNTTTIMLAQFFALLFYIAVVYIAIIIIPYGKYVLLTVAGFPIILQQASSCSYDINVYAMSVLVISLCLSCIKTNVGWKKLVVLWAVSLVLAPCKMIYCFVSFLMFAVPNNHFKNYYQMFVGKIIIPISNVLCAVMYNMSTISNSSGGGNYIEWADEQGYTISYALTHLQDTIYVWLSTFHNNIAYYINSTLGGSLGWVEISLPFHIMMLLVLMLVVTTKTEERVFIKYSTRLYYILIFFFVSLMACVSMFLAWTPINAGVIQGVQGRYFLPVVPLLLIALLQENSKNLLLCRKSVPIGMLIVNYLTFINVFEQIINR